MHAQLQLTSSQIAADAAAATLSMLAGPAALGPAPGPQRLLGQPAQGSLASTPPGLPARPPSLASQGEASPDDKLLTKEELLALVAKGWLDPTFGSGNNSDTLARKLRVLKKYLASLLPNEDSKSSLVSALTNKAAITGHLSSMPSSSRKLGTSAFKAALGVLQLQLSPSHPSFWDVHKITPKLLDQTQSKAALTYRKELVSKKLAIANENDTCGITFLVIKEAVEGAGRGRFDLLIKAASSWLHKVRMDETEAQQLFLELAAGVPHNVDRFYPILSRRQEDVKLFGEIVEEPEPPTDMAGTLLKLSRFPASWVSEINEILFLNLQVSVKPERVHCLLNMNCHEAMTLEESLCVKLAVCKPSCSYDSSMCVVTEPVAQMLRSYRLIIKPITARRGYRTPKTLINIETPYLIQVVKAAHAQWISRPILQKAQRGMTSSKKWSAILKIVKNKLSPGQATPLKKLSSHQVSYIYYNNACDQFFRSPANSPLLVRPCQYNAHRNELDLILPICHITLQQMNPIKSMVRLGFSKAQANLATTTYLRAKREQVQ